MSLPYKEGTWFAIPLRQGGYAVGVVARHVPVVGNIILAYFFGPKREAVPAIDELDELIVGSAIKVARISDLGITEGSWPVIGDFKNWNRMEWPMPYFIRIDEIGKTAWRVVYADDNPNQVVSQEKVPYETTEYERNWLYGAGAAEIVISQLLS